MTINGLRRITAVLIALVGSTAVVAAGLVGAGDTAVLAVERAELAPPIGEAVAASASQPVPAAPTTTTTTTTAPPPAPTTTAATAATTAPPPPPPPPAPAPAAPAPTPAPAPAPAPAPQPTPTSSAARDTGCESNMIRWMNEARAAHGLGALANDQGIQWVPVGWSDSMASRQQLSHNPNYGAQIFGARPHARTASENVGRSTGGDRLVFDGFMNSPGHRARILDPANSHTTTGCVVDGGGQLWVTVNFWG